MQRALRVGMIGIMEDMVGEATDRASLPEIRAADAMRAGVLTCPPETPLSVVARMMASYRVHCIVVTEPVSEADSFEQPWRVISDLDLVRAAGPELSERTARAFASEDALTVASDDSLEQVTRVMSKNGVAHVVVRDARGRPVGVISTLDVIDVLARAR